MCILYMHERNFSYNYSVPPEYAIIGSTPLLGNFLAQVAGLNGKKYEAS